MIRRRRRTAHQTAALAYKQAAPHGIGSTRDKAKAEAEALESAIIEAVREWIWAHRSSCQLCHGRRSHECLGGDEMHEDPPRSKTRGLPPWERFNLRVCGRLCQACHRDVTEHRLRIVFADPERRFMGPVTGVPVKGKESSDVCS